MRSAKILLLCAWLAGSGRAAPLTLPVRERPEWLRRDGVVMAGSWEPLLFRVRRDGSEGYEPTPAQRAAYRREHSPAMVARLKALGANFVMMHCYKGFGLAAERESMADAVRFARLCHEAGLRVGVYVYSGAFGWELFFREMPRARDWVILDREGRPRRYGRVTYRYYWNRNHPEARSFYRGIVRFAVEDIRADLLHFDNYTVGPGRDANSVARFRAYLRETFAPEARREIGIPDPARVMPPMTGPPSTILRRAWLAFSCRSLADSYRDMSRYARTLRPKILVECNPGGVRDRIRPPVDHGRLLQGGEAFWDEGRPPGYRDGRLDSRIRTYKVARAMDNMAFAYTTNPLELAESMAFNLDCLGCIAWFEYGRIVEKPGSKEAVSKAIAPYVRFFHARRDLYRDARVIADVAVLRSFPSQVFADPRFAGLTASAERELIRKRIPFQIIHDHQLRDLSRYRALLLAGCVALSDAHIEAVRRYAESGGRLCILGPAATHDAWMRPRARGALDDVRARRLDAAEKGQVVEALRHLCGGAFSASVDGPDGLCAEFTAQEGRRLVHLVNYRPEAAEGIAVRLVLPPGRHAGQVRLASPSRARDIDSDPIAPRRAGRPASPSRPRDIDIPFREEAGTLAFAVPRVGVYEIAIVTLE